MTPADSLEAGLMPQPDPAATVEGGELASSPWVGLHYATENYATENHAADGT